MKKLCFITTIPLTLNTFVLKTAVYLHEHADWDISFICDYDKEFADSLPEYIHYYPIPMERGISIKGIGAMLNMRKIFREEKFDLIQYSTPNASLYASLAGKLVNVPVRLYCQWGMAYTGFKGTKRSIFKLIEKVVCRLSTWIEPDSKSNLAFAHSENLYPESKGSVIWNGSACGIDLNKFDHQKKQEYRTEIRNLWSIPSDAFVYGFVGRITRDKGVNELLEAYREVDSNTYLLMVGPEEVDSTINAELYNWSLDNKKIIYTGYTSEVEKYLAAMDCYILPSYREGFGMSTVEAEAMGVPVIVTNIPGPIDAMEENKTGIIVKKADAASLKCAMELLYKEKDQGILMGQHGIEFVKNRFEQKQLFRYIFEDRCSLMQKTGK